MTRTPIIPQTADRLREWRRDLGLTQEQLAVEANVSRSLIARVELGLDALSSATAGHLCRAFSRLLDRRVQAWEVWPEQFSDPNEFLDAPDAQQGAQAGKGEGSRLKGEGGAA